MDTQEESARRIQRIREGELLDVIREKPVLYMGESTLTALYHFLGGYETAKYIHQIPLRNILPIDFNDWVAYRLHFRESSSGYKRMILQHFPDESVALDQFFRLIDEHRTRRGKTVATVRCHPSNPDVFRWEQGELKSKRRLSVAEEIKLLTYTDDPGFFVAHDDQAAEHPEKSSFRPALSWIPPPYSPDLDYLTVLDQGEYDRLCREDLMFRQRQDEQMEDAKRRFESNRVN